MLSAQSLVCSFDRPHGERMRAVNNVNITLNQGEALGLVGESGCGKSTLLRLLLRLHPADSGDIRFIGTDITRATGRALVGLRRDVQAVFQNPHAALDPRLSVFAAVAEPLRIQAQLSRRALNEHVEKLLHDVGLPGEFLWRYPHELSGGQKQRVCIARALAPGPKAVLLDEPTSALDVSMQAQIINLLAELRRRERLAFLLVSHNLAVVQQLCERVAVMNAGRIVEEGSARTVLTQPTHPYTQTLVDAVLPPRWSPMGRGGKM